jgi:hypothetical protein
MLRRLELTFHARAALSDRRLAFEWVVRTVNDPDATEPDQQWPEAVRAFKAIPERDGRVLRVVYIPVGIDIARVLTVFFDRGRRR